MAELPDGYASLMQVAVDGVKDAFAAASEFLGQQKPLHHLAAEWACALPRGLQACLAAGPAAFPDYKPCDPAARAFGEQCLRGAWGPHQLVQAVAAAYEGPLAEMRQLAAGPSPEQQLQQLLTAEAAFTGFAARLQAAPSSAGGTPGGAAQQQDQQHAVTPVMHWGAQPSHDSDQQQQQPQQQPQPAGQAGAAPPPCAQLTAGAAARLHKGVGPDGDPLCVQVIGMKPLKSQGGGRELMRVLLSDGVHSHPCLLASQLSELVASGGLRQGAIVSLHDWVGNAVAGKKFVIVLSLQVLQPEAPPVGNPQLYDKAAAQPDASGPAAAAPQGGQAHGLPPGMPPPQQFGAPPGMPPQQQFGALPGMQQQQQFGVPPGMQHQQQGPPMQQYGAPQHQQHGGWPPHSHQWQQRGADQHPPQYGAPHIQQPLMQQQAQQQRMQYGAPPLHQQPQCQLPPHMQQQQAPEQPHWAANHRYPPVAPQPPAAAQQQEQQQGGKRPGGGAVQADNPAKKRYLRGGNAEAAARSRAAAAAAADGGLDAAQRAAIAHEVAADSNSDDDFK
jgi:hypothetical protein